LAQRASRAPEDISLIYRDDNADRSYLQPEPTGFSVGSK